MENKKDELDNDFDEFSDIEEIVEYKRKQKFRVPAAILLVLFSVFLTGVFFSTCSLLIQ